MGGFVSLSDIVFTFTQLLVSVALVEYAVAHSIIISYTGIETLHLRRKKTDEESPAVSNAKLDAFAHAQLKSPSAINAKPDAYAHGKLESLVRNRRFFSLWASYYFFAPLC